MGRDEGSELDESEFYRENMDGDRGMKRPVEADRREMSEMVMMGLIPSCVNLRFRVGFGLGWVYDS